MTRVYVPVAKEAAAWECAAERGEFTIREIRHAGDMTKAQAISTVHRWEEDGAVVFVRKIERAHRLYRINPEYRRPPAPAGRTPEENMWQAMRRLRTFSALDLASHATTGVVSVTQSQARAYLRALHLTGYVRCQRKASGDASTFLLARDSGPFAPVLKRIRVIEDINTGEIVHLDGGAA